MLYLLDYGAGNIQSLANSLTKLGHAFEWVREPADIGAASKLLFPGVGAFGSAMHALNEKGYAEPLRAYIASGRPYMGICVGMQALLEGSDESPTVRGLGVIPTRATRFCTQHGARRKAVPHMGWNSVDVAPADAALAGKYGLADDGHYYFVHSFYMPPDAGAVHDWVLGTTQYGDESFVSVVQRGNVFATQFHPEKSGAAGLAVLRAWLALGDEPAAPPRAWGAPCALPAYRLPTRRIVACLDVRSNDLGDLVVTKGESYDVRERDAAADVRNMGKPVELAQRYYREGADEVTFLNITSFRNCPLQDQPMLALVRLAAATIFVPLTIGGGIRDSTDPDGTVHSALEVAHAYFRAGADKVSIGSEAVYAVERLLQRMHDAGVPGWDPAQAPPAALRGDTGIEQISEMYGAQAVVVSVDPHRVYLGDGDAVPEAHAASIVSGADERAGRIGEPARWWYRCTVKGGREHRDVDVVQLARGVERLGAGELLVNSIDRDGSNRGFDTLLVDLVRAGVGIPIVASSGAGSADHFATVFEARDATGGAPIEAALAAGIFHRREVSIAEVKQRLGERGFVARGVLDTEDV
ncbi:dCMP deaminase [Malassezia sp. CBS 17886]|nr:dCMP deaminase [Malassezia sp. CBS 17886]